MLDCREQKTIEKLSEELKKLAILIFLSRSFIRSQEQQVYVVTSL